MYKSIGDYSPSKETNGHKILHIKQGETFEFLEVCNKHWWKMRSSSGKEGLVPVNFLEASTQVTMEEKSSVLESIDRAIDAIYKNAGERGELDHNQRTKLQKLIEHRRKVFSEYIKQKSPSGKKHSSKMGAAYSSEANIPQQPNRPAPSPPSQGRKSFSTKRLAPEPPKQDDEVPPKIGSELVEQVRISTGLTHTKSIVAVETILMHIRHRVPSISNAADYILESLYHSQENSAKLSDEELLETHDGQVLQGLLEELVKHKDDSQQRSWAVHEDESVIGKYLEDVLSILEGANPQVCLAVVRQDSYDGLNALVQYYQMETRASLRLLLLKIFCSCCSLGQDVISQLLCTILPVELARDMKATREMPTSTEVVHRFLHSARLSTIIFSTGEAIPYQHYEYLNNSFVDFLIDTVENAPNIVEEEEEEEEIINMFVNVILSYNQHFDDIENNMVMQVLSERRTSKVLTEKLMLLVNRGDDPVNTFGFLNRCPDSLLKFFEDIFSSDSTSGIFFTNDLMVLIDIVLRQVQDLSPGDKWRTEYLSLLHGILSTTDYPEYKHQHVEIGKCLKRINEEEGPEVKKDQLIVGEIFKMFSNIFST